MRDPLPGGAQVSPAAAHPLSFLRWRSTFQLGDPQPQERDGQDQGVNRQACQHDREDGVQDTKNANGRTQIHCYPPIDCDPRLARNALPQAPYAPSGIQQR